MALSKSNEIKVGLFALITLGAFLASIIVLTSKTSLFRSTITLETSFKDIAGLINGSEVRLSGVTVGFVKDIRFSPEEGDPTVFVDFSIDDRGMDRVNKDGVATISSLGLLGKKYLEVVPGDISAGLVEDGDFLKGIDPASMAEALDKAGVVLDNIGETSAHLKTLFASIAGEGDAQTELSRTIANIRRITSEVESGKGVLHELIYSPAKAEILNDLKATVANIRTISKRIEEGPGNVHEIIYGEQIKVFLDDLRQTSEVLRAVITDVRDESGVIHGLIYDEDKAQMLEDLKKSAANLAKISERIERGEGTLGGLLIDPTIYEDLKKLTGEVERNRVLKTYIRYVVQKREADLEESLEPPKTPVIEQPEEDTDTPQTDEPN
ncbi:MAG: MlaD family protein [Candidatus Lernaella stagnicola]|nr:MlaD family protein [Candidatus Lernaella stagnicola]